MTTKRGRVVYDPIEEDIYETNLELLKICFLNEKLGEETNSNKRATMVLLYTVLSMGGLGALVMIIKFISSIVVQ